MDTNKLMNYNNQADMESIITYVFYFVQIKKKSNNHEESEDMNTNGYCRDKI